ncbi:MAG: DUF177 domain-containing protein [Acidobacteriota bacterium]|nr:DUF177 domain-containing protein [Acidobacteriota bacterium]
MHIEVENLTETGRPFAHIYGAGALDLADERARLTGETRISGRASRQREGVKLQGEITTTVEINCDRCLTPISMPVEAAFDVNYVDVETDAATEEATELQPEDLSVSFYEGDAIDLDELAREQVLLALPVRLLCREECKGLCPNCGAERNTQPCACEDREVDPRWGALATLKDRE